jgi:hypothetical protein
MTIETPPAPVAGQGAAAAGAPTAWHGTDYAALVQTKGWKSPDDALKSYAELETFRGAPAERLLKLPEKPDDPAWADVRKRVGWSAPEKPEDYGIAVPDGFPAEYAQTIAATAHKLGVPKDTLLALAAENDKFVQAQLQQQDAQLKERLTAADQAFAKENGAKHAEVSELVQRTLAKSGLTPEAVSAVEETLALQGDGSAVLAFRKFLATAAQAGRESPIHTDGAGGGAMSAEQAKQALATKRQNVEWVSKALTRGTTEAEENIRLNIIATGGTPDDATVKRLASGIATG